MSFMLFFLCMPSLELLKFNIKLPIHFTQNNSLQKVFEIVVINKFRSKVDICTDAIEVHGYTIPAYRIIQCYSI